MIDISVIIPYYNESDTIKVTLDLLNKQTYKPKEIIFVNSSSTDQTSNIIDKWIEDNVTNSKVKYLNIKTDSKTPSTSKNIGIKNARFKWLAFMDCGLYFSRTWLNDLVFQVKNSTTRVDIISGVCQLNGYTVFDRCAVAHTYGVGTNRVCIPGSLVRKSVFISTGLFLENMRASYDRAWQKKMQQLCIKRITPEQHSVSYIGINFSSSLFRLSSKVFTYSRPAVYLAKYKTPKLYLLYMFFSISLLIFYWIAGIVNIVFYLIIRGYFIPIIKSHKYKELFKDARVVTLLPIVGLAIDLSRFYGYIYEYTLKALKNV